MTRKIVVVFVDGSVRRHNPYTWAANCYFAWATLDFREQCDCVRQSPHVARIWEEFS